MPVKPIRSRSHWLVLVAAEVVPRAECSCLTKLGPVKLSAMADVFPDKLNGAFDSLKQSFKEMVDVPEERKFIGFDAYKQAMDSLKKGDVVILTTPPAFRWVGSDLGKLQRSNAA